MSVTSVTVTRTDQRVVLAVGVAMQQRCRIERCAVCGGPEVFSKHRPRSRCLRCGSAREHLAPKQHASSWRRCAVCREQTMAGRPLRATLCRLCAGLSSRERSKRRRWEVERRTGLSSTPPNASMNTGLDSRGMVASATLGRSAAQTAQETPCR
jgi:hypothetical protein